VFWIYISLDYATFLLGIREDGICIEAPPIANWTIGKDQNFLVRHFSRKGATIARLE
jgi:hypothetical protein